MDCHISFAMVEELKRRTSNFFPPTESIEFTTSPSVSSPNTFPRDPFYERQSSAIRTSSLLSTPSFLSPARNFPPYHLENTFLHEAPVFPDNAPASGLGLSNTSLEGMTTPRTRMESLNAFNLQFAEREFELSLVQQLHVLALGKETVDPSSNYTLGEGSSSFGLPRPDSSFSLTRSSIWSTPKPDGSPSFQNQMMSAPGNNHQLQSPFNEPKEPHREPPKDKKVNIYSTKINTPIFVPGEKFASVQENAKEPKLYKEPQHTLVKKTDHGRREPKQDVGKPPIVVKLSGKKRSVVLPDTESNLSALCGRYILSRLNVKEYPEDYCSTFYKRNKHGYMFIRESSSSLKVNNSGPKSWVTIKLKLGKLEQQKLKVDAKKLPVWKPINLNQPSGLRKYAKKERRPKNGPKRGAMDHKR